jgi:glycosyltransferase involved in cell wall biosynthesis
MNVLLISQAYPPYPVVGALRARKLAEAFRAQGHRVVVVTERLPDEGAGLRTDAPDLRVHTVALGDRYRVRAMRMVRRLTRLGRSSTVADAPAWETSAPTDVTETEAAGSARAGWLRRFVLGLLWLPDDEQRFILPAFRTARAVLRETPIDVVYTTAPYFSTHLVGLMLKRSARVRWVAEFRDPWTDQRAIQVPDPVAVIEALHRWLERRCLRAADKVVAVTEAARRLLAEKVPPAQRGKFILALNGIDELSAPGAEASAGPRRIVYAGTFYYNRDPRPFLAALAAVRRRHGLGPDALRVDLVGRCRSYDGLSVERMVAEHGLADLVHFHDWMSNADAQAMLRSADLLFLIALSQPLQVPNKLYDYLGTRRPMLAVVDAGGETERMLREVGGHLVVPVARGGQPGADTLTEHLDQWLRSGDGAGAAAADEATLRSWLASRQMELVVSAAVA